MANTDIVLWEAPDPDSAVQTLPTPSSTQSSLSLEADRRWLPALVEPPTSELQPTGATSDLNVIQDAVIRAQRGESARNVAVDPSGAILAYFPGDVDETRVANVVGDTFYAPDLNAIQAAVLAAQRNGGRAEDKDQLYVDQTGEVLLGSEVDDPTRVARVAGDTFYARDVALEERVVRTKMPAAVKVTDGNHEGYAYWQHNTFGDSYQLFIYHDAAYDVYRVSLLHPRLGGEFDVHDGHLYPDGTLCLTRQAGSGYVSMEQTYAKAALWTYGASLYRRGHGFQFNLDQDG